MEDYKKKYEQALERAKNYCDGHYTDVSPKAMSEYLFPELKESEDEKIRKSLIDMLKNDEKCYLKEIAWLEKQGTPSKLSEKEQNRFAKGVLTSCAMSFINYLDAHKHEGKMCVSNGECEDIERAFHNAMWDRLHRYYCKYIEKQGEQKPTLPKWKYKKDHTPLLRDSIILNKYGCVAKSPSGAIISDAWVLDYNELAKLPKEELEKQGEKLPADKVEPKFKVGDIIRHKKKGFTCKIIAVDTEYRLSECNGTHLPFDFQDSYELVEQNPAWSEEDESNLQGIIDEIEANKHSAPDYDLATYDRFLSWLKSLKDRLKGE